MSGVTAYGTVCRWGKNKLYHCCCAFAIWLCLRAVIKYYCVSVKREPLSDPPVEGKTDILCCF